MDEQIVLARDGGMSEVKYLLPEVVGAIEATVSDVNLDHPNRSGRHKSINEVNSHYVTDLLMSGGLGGSTMRKASSGVSGGGLSFHGGSLAASRASSQSPTRDNSILATR